jgi:hypothetical protein
MGLRALLKQDKKLGLLGTVLLFAASLLVFNCGSVLAVATISSSAIAQGYKSADQGIVTAAIVSLQKNSNNTVERSTVANVSRLAGVVSDTSLIDMSAPNAKTRVVTSGLALTLVCDINGQIVAGDKITASPIPGVGMRATENTTIVGMVQTGLGSSSQIENRVVKDSEGQTHTVRIGLVPVQVGVSSYIVPNAPTGVATLVPPFIQSLANALAGRSVPPLRVITVLVIVLLTFIGVAMILYASIKSSMISIGRNPLSEKAVYRGLTRIGLVTIMALLLVVLIIYSILKF